MKTQEIKYSVKNLMHRKTRSWLTVLSILIGITAIFALTSFGLGIQNYINELAEEAGADKLYLQARGIGAPGTDPNFFISQDDIDFVDKINGVGEIVPLYMSVAEVYHKDEVTYQFIVASDPDKSDFVEENFGFSIFRGRELDGGDTDKVTLGYRYWLDDEIFKRGLEIGDKLEINDVKFEVIGFYDEVGNPQDDGNVYMTPRGFETLFPSKKEKYGFAIFEAEAGVDPDSLADKVTEDLRKNKGQEEGEEDFFVQTFADVIETFGSILSVLTGVLLLIGLVSLIVAAVNIMNTMYTAVLERTKEIGIMKAIGARNEDIMFIFVFESGLLGMIGGIAGVIFGYIVALTGGYIAASYGYSSLQPVFPLWLIVGSILFAFFVGAASGYLPAKRAAELNPVDALRYE